MNIIDKHYFKYYNTKYYVTYNLIIIIELFRSYNNK